VTGGESESDQAHSLVDQAAGHIYDEFVAARTFEGNRAETTTILPVIREFMKAHRLGGRDDRG
jgi:hypothetical protein